ncbi:hypothetical protein RF11_13181 [Thelohanellus kitauei]|uniref:Uncharacterized protein n=1 Tax=Thelohanellus kitauei TaxID=669202 RepID=A0A0C2IZH1_THEKT|nr:hypothetical protein RF11_13181 [Thelohanellus kitauei]
MVILEVKSRFTSQQENVQIGNAALSDSTLTSTRRKVSTLNAAQKGLSHVDNVTIEVDAKYIQNCTERCFNYIPGRNKKRLKTEEQELSGSCSLQRDLKKSCLDIHNKGIVDDSLDEKR